MSIRDTEGFTWLLLLLATVCVALAVGIGYRTLRGPEPVEIGPEVEKSPDGPLSGRIDRVRSRDAGDGFQSDDGATP
jgi:hypothetical protein